MIIHMGSSDSALTSPEADVILTFRVARSVRVPLSKVWTDNTGNFATTQWYTFPNATIQGNTVTLHLVDGRLGDRHGG